MGDKACDIAAACSFCEQDIFWKETRQMMGLSDRRLTESLVGRSVVSAIQSLILSRTKRGQATTNNHDRDQPPILFLGNSLSIRNMEKTGKCSQPGKDGSSLTDDTAYGSNLTHVRIGCNRGVSGIDGLLSTALGFSRGHNVPVWAL